MLRILFLVICIGGFAFGAKSGSAEPRLPDAKNGTDPKVIHLRSEDKNNGVLTVYDKKDVFISVPGDRSKLNNAERSQLGKAMINHWRVGGDLSATEAGGQLAVNEKGEVFLSPLGGSSWSYEFQEGQGTSVARIKCTDPLLENRYLRASDKTEDYQIGEHPLTTVKVRRLYLVADDGDWFYFIGGSK